MWRHAVQVLAAHLSQSDQIIIQIKVKVFQGLELFWYQLSILRLLIYITDYFEK